MMLALHQPKAKVKAKVNTNQQLRRSHLCVRSAKRIQSKLPVIDAVVLGRAAGPVSALASGRRTMAKNAFFATDRAEWSCVVNVSHAWTAAALAEILRCVGSVTVQVERSAANAEDVEGVSARIASVSTNKPPTAQGLGLSQQRELRSSSAALPTSKN
jgi:hypothetical protein